MTEYMTADEYDEKYSTLYDEVESLRDRIENLGKSKTKRVDKNLADKLEQLTKQLNELDNIEVLDDFDDDVEDNWIQEDEDEDRQLDREILADDIEELKQKLGYSYIPKICQKANKRIALSHYSLSSSPKKMMGKNIKLDPKINQELKKIEQLTDDAKKVFNHCMERATDYNDKDILEALNDYSKIIDAYSQEIDDFGHNLERKNNKAYKDVFYYHHNKCLEHTKCLSNYYKERDKAYKKEKQKELEAEIQKKKKKMQDDLSGWTDVKEVLKIIGWVALICIGLPLAILLAIIGAWSDWEWFKFKTRKQAQIYHDEFKRR